MSCADCGKGNLLLDTVQNTAVVAGISKPGVLRDQTTPQWQAAVTAHFSSEQLLLFAFVFF